jgi:serine/threonine protein kinase
MGRVVEVVPVPQGTHLALKYCDGSPLERKRLIREARILGALDHPHLLPVFEANLAHDPPYFVMPLATQTLEAELHGRRRDLAWTTRVFREICLGVQALHESGVIHRDLKPANVLQLPDGRHVVADLGTAKREPRDSTILTRTCAILGTLSYLAPEQLLPEGSRRADGRTDIYQLGKILYQMHTGRSPAVIEPAALPGGLARIVLRASANCPSDRYDTVHDLLRSIETLDESSGRGAAENPALVLERLTTLLQVRRPSGVSLREHKDDLLDALARIDRLEPDAAIDAFDRLPREILAGLAKQDAGRLLGPLRVYTRAIEQTAARRPFAYADHVARRVQALMQATSDPEILACALEALLIASVALNRYSAMASFKSLLYEVRRAEVALPVSEMLRASADYLREIAFGLRADRLHPIIRSAVDELDWLETVSF